MTPYLPLYPVLAEVPSLPAPDSFQSIGWLLVCLGALVAIANQALKLIDRNKPTPPLHQEYATKAELKAAEDRMARQVSLLTETLQASSARTEQMVVRIHERIEGLSDKIFHVAAKQ